MEHRWVLKQDNTIETPGVDYGPRGLEFGYRVDDMIVVKWPGHNVWSGRGQQSYHKAVWIVARVLSEGCKGTDLFMKIEEVAELEVGSRSKKSFSAARKLACEHAKFKPFTFVCPACNFAAMRSASGASGASIVIECEKCAASVVYSYDEEAGCYSPKRREANGDG